MSHVLYRKHRSQTFDELIGQEHVASILKNAVAQEQVSHAYLLYGPRGLGKTSTARILAKAVNCLQLQPDGNPCTKCEVCLAIQEGRFLDLIEIDAASNRGIDQIRELKERIEFSPSEGKKKVYIIDEVHMLTTEAFNALLKTLEEPPPHAIFILATTEIHKVPATILSRCQRFDFRLGSEEDIRTLILGVSKQEKISFEDEALDLIIDNARGSYRDALSLLDVVVSGQKEGDDPSVVTEEEVRAVLGLADSTMVYFFLEKIVNGESAEALDLIDELAQKGVNLGQFVTFVLSVLREILIGDLKHSKDAEEYSFAQKLDRRKTLRLINLFVDAERSLKNALVPTLPLEILVADSLDIFGDEEDEATSDTEGNGAGGTSGSGRKNTTGRHSSAQKSPTSKKASRKPVAKENSKKKTVKQNASASRSSGSVADPTEEVKKGANSSDSSTQPESKISMDAADLEEHWDEVLKELRAYNSHLYAFVGRSKVIELSDGVLRLAVAFDFHKDRIESPKSRDAIADVFRKVFGQPVKLECIIDGSIRASVKPAAEVVVMEEVPVQAKAEVASKPKNIYDSVSEVFGDELVGM